jgi:pterin-4a-carbinolamine dehydratase
MSSEPFASIVIPTFARPRPLRRALLGLLAQDLPDWEAIVVDDGDGQGLAAAATFDDERIRASRSPGTGPVDARNAAIAVARGRVVCWLDDDDWWDDRAHLSLLEAAAADDSRFFFRGGFVVYEDGEGAELSREPFDHDASERSLRTNNTILTSSLAYPRELHAKLGPLDPEVGGYCDWDFMIRMCDAGLRPEKLPGLGVCYAVHDSSLSARFDAPERRRYFERFRDKHRLDVELANHVRIHRMLTEMPVPEGWEEVDGALQREFELESFMAAIGFVNRVAELAEAENHHPDIAVDYKRVTLRWRTHSAEAITDRDREMARRSAALA